MKGGEFLSSPHYLCWDFPQSPRVRGCSGREVKREWGSGLGHNDRRWSLSFSSLEGWEAHTIAASR